MPSERLLAALAEIFAGYDDADPPVLLGGLAVYVRLADGRTLTVEAAMADHTLLALAERPTQDIDLCVRTPRAQARLAAHLQLCGFARDTARRDRYRLNDVNVDIITPEVTSVAYAEGMADPLALESSRTILIAARAALVISKSCAWHDRREDRDLVDLARLALADLTAQALPDTVARLHREEPQLSDKLRSVREQFMETSSRGPGAFFAALQAWTAGVDADRWLDNEEDVRDAVVIAVERMFSDCGFDEEPF